MSPYYVCCGYDLHLDRSVVDFSIYLRHCSAANIYFSFRWGPFVYSLGIVQWDSTRRDHLGYPGRVFGSGPVMIGPTCTGSVMSPNVVVVAPLKPERIRPTEFNICEECFI